MFENDMNSQGFIMGSCHVIFHAFFTHFKRIFNVEISFLSIGLHDVCARSFSVSLATQFSILTSGQPPLPPEVSLLGRS